MIRRKRSNVSTPRKISIKALKVLLTSACLALLFSNLTSAKDVSVVAEFDSGIAVSFQLQRVRLDANQELIIRYQVKNKSRRDIYLIVTNEPAHGADQSKKQFFLYLEKDVLNYHYFEFPKVKQIKAGKSYRGEAKLSLSLQENPFEGEWSVFLSIGYIEGNAMTEFHASKRGQQTGLAKSFEKAQRIVSAGPLKLPSLARIISPTIEPHCYLPCGEDLGAGNGRITAQGYSANDGTHQHFTQKERDNETGLDYFGAN